MGGDGAANRIISNIASRERTDLVVPPGMAAVVVLAYIAVVLSYALGLLSEYGASAPPPEQMLALAAALMVGAGLVAAIFHLLAARDSKHAEREAGLRRALIEYARENDVVCGADLSSFIAELEELDSAASAEKAARLGGWRWALISAPAAAGAAAVLCAGSAGRVLEAVLACYALSVAVAVLACPGVTTFPREHEDATVPFLEKYSEISAALGLGRPEMRRTVGRRRFWPFVALTCATLGAFFVFWVYAVFNDMNRHFEEQWRYEDALFKGVRSGGPAFKGYKLEDHWLRGWTYPAGSGTP